MIELAVIMDPIQNINLQTDSTIALILEGQRRNWIIQYIQADDCFMQNGIVWAKMQTIKLNIKKAIITIELSDKITIKPLHECSFSFLRKDPPFDLSYLYLSYLLEHAEKQDHLIVNKPSSVRDANEKIFASYFPQCCPATLISSQATIIKDFLNEHKQVIFKPLDSMGGHLIFLLEKGDRNINVVIETLTHKGHRPLMVQQFIPDIQSTGDKRILLIDGIPYPYALSRIPDKEDIRGNLAAGGKGIAAHLTPKEEWICKQIGPTLKAKGLFFVGIDVIGGYLTEINVTSPTGIRQIDALFNINTSAAILDSLLEKYNQKI